MTDKSDQSGAETENKGEKSRRSHVGCLLIGMILLPVFYLLSIPWVVQMIRPAYLYGGPAGWSDKAVSTYIYPSELLYDMSDTYKAFAEPYGRFVRRTIERLSP